MSRLVQIPIHRELHQHLKNQWKVFGYQQNDFCIEAVDWFLKEKKLAGDFKLHYLASHNRPVAHIISLWLPQKTFDRLKVFSEKQSVAYARVIYSAIIYYSENIGALDPTEL